MTRLRGTPQFVPCTSKALSWRMGMRQWSSGQVIRNVVRSQMALAACLALVSTTVMAQGATRIAPLDTTAINALRRMGSYLRGLAAFTVEGQTLQDEMLPNGQYASVAGTLSYIV